MRILVIGHPHPNSYVENLAKSFLGMGHETWLLSNKDILNFYPEELRIEYDRLRKPISLKLISKQIDPELIFIEQSHMLYDNDVENTIVWTNMREIFIPPSVTQPDIFSYGHPECIRMYIQFHKWEMNNVPRIMFLPTAVNPDTFEVKDKLYRKPMWIGYPNAYRYLEINMLWDIFNELQADIERRIVKCKFIDTIKTPVSWKEYKDWLERAKYRVIWTDPYNILTRRIWEAAVCKSFLLIYVKNDKIRKFYEQLGLKDHENCLFFDNMDFLRVFSVREERYKEIVNNAYEWVMNNYTFDRLAKIILREVAKYKKSLKDTIKKIDKTRKKILEKIKKEEEDEIIEN